MRVKKALAVYRESWENEKIKVCGRLDEDKGSHIPEKGISEIGNSKEKDHLNLST